MSAMTVDQETLIPEQTALVIVDVQNDFCHPSGAKALAGAELSAIQAMVPQLARIVTEARAQGVHILFVQTEHSPWSDTPRWLARSRAEAADRPLTCRSGSWGAELYGLEPRPEDRIVTKHRYSAFFGTDLDLILRSRGIQTTLVTGVLTNVCVESTVRDAFSYGYRTILLADGCASTDNAAHEAALKNLGRHFGEVTTWPTLRTNLPRPPEPLELVAR